MKHSMEIEGKLVDGIKDVVSWICCSPRKIDIKQTYLLQKNDGSQEKDYTILTNFLFTSRLAVESVGGKGGGRGGFVIKRLESDQDLEHMAAHFKVWLGSN